MIGLLAESAPSNPERNSKKKQISNTEYRMSNFEGRYSIDFKLKDRATRGASACAARATSTIRQSSFVDRPSMGFYTRKVTIYSRSRILDCLSLLFLHLSRSLHDNIKDQGQQQDDSADQIFDVDRYVHQVQSDTQGRPDENANDGVQHTPFTTGQ